MLLQMVGFSSYSWLNNVYICMCVLVSHIFLIFSSVDRHWDHFHILTIVSNAVMNMAVEKSLWDTNSVTFAYISEVGLLDHMAVLFLIFWKRTILCSIMAAPIYVPINSVQEIPFLHILASTCYFLPFW